MRTGSRRIGTVPGEVPIGGPDWLVMRSLERKYVVGVDRDADARADRGERNIGARAGEHERLAVRQPEARLDGLLLQHEEPARVGRSAAHGVGLELEAEEPDVRREEAAERGLAERARGRVGGGHELA